MLKRWKIALGVAGAFWLRGCVYLAAAGGNPGGAGGLGAPGSILGAGPGGTGAGGAGVPAFVNPFQQTPIAQPGIHPGAGGP